MFQTQTTLALGAALVLAGCTAPSVSPDLGPMKYDAGGTMPCSAKVPSYSEACGWRVVRKADGGAEIWISNIASEATPAYRVLEFSRGEFSSRDGTPLQVSNDADTWSVSVPDREYYRSPDALITGG